MTTRWMLNVWVFCLVLAAVPAAVSPASATVPARVRGMRYLLQHVDQLPLPRPKAVRARETPAPVTVGGQRQFLVAGDLMLRTGTCRYVGEHCYIFVEDAQWDTNGGSIFQSHVDVLGQLFEQSTPTDPQRGMYQLECEAFGTPVDVDGDPRIFIFVVELVDPQLVGFFDPRVATWPDPDLRRDTVYLDAGMLRSRPYLARGTLAHEFQHLIHYGYDADEETWLNEGLSGYAEALTGFPETDTSMVDAFLVQPDFNLTYWPATANAAHYGSTYLFVAFLAERFGTELIRTLVAEPRNGTFAVDAALRTLGRVDDFTSVWSDWIVANYAAADDLYGYAALRGRRIHVYPAPPLPFADIGGIVAHRWGTTAVMVYPSGPGPGGVTVSLEGEDTGRLSVWAYVMRQHTAEVVPMELAGGVCGRIAVDAADSVAIIIGRTSPQGGEFRLAAAALAQTAITDAQDGVLPPSTLRLRAYPNPFNSTTVISFQVAGGQDEVALTIHDVLGRCVAELLRGRETSGVHRLGWDGRDMAGRRVASGVYLARLRLGERQQVVKLALTQ